MHIVGGMARSSRRHGALHLGTSGYVYAHWRGLLYPRGLPTSRWLPHYASVFSCVELNAPFYRLPTPEAVAGWRSQVPAGFRFAVKGSRYLTHMRKLLDTGEGLARYFGVIRGLGDTLGPVLWQLPRQLTRPDLTRLGRFLDALPRDVQHVFEFRHPAWYAPEVLDLLDAHDVAVCEHDLLPVQPPRHTGPLRYVRFHGGVVAPYAGRYTKRALRPWAEDLLAWRAKGGVAWVFFNNDLHGHALVDALDLSELLGEPLPMPEPLRPLASS